MFLLLCQYPAPPTPTQVLLALPPNPLPSHPFSSISTATSCLWAGSLPELPDWFLASPVTPPGNSPYSYLKPLNGFPLFLEHILNLFLCPKLLITYIDPSTSCNSPPYSLGFSHTDLFQLLKLDRGFPILGHLHMLSLPLSGLFSRQSPSRISPASLRLWSKSAFLIIPSHSCLLSPFPELTTILH